MSPTTARRIARALSIICILAVIIMTISLTLPIMAVIERGRTPKGADWFALVLGYSIACGIPALLAFGYWSLRRWAWWLHVVCHFIGLAALFVGAVVGGVISLGMLIFLFWFRDAYFALSAPAMPSET